METKSLFTCRLAKCKGACPVDRMQCPLLKLMWGAAKDYRLHRVVCAVQEATEIDSNPYIALQLVAK